MSPAERQHRFRVILAFTLLYVFWGSTYLAIRVAVRQIPPALLSGARFLIAGPLMLGYCALNGRRVRLQRSEAVSLAITGIMLLTGSNAVLCWAEQWVPSGLAALIASITPLWFLVLETWVLPGEHRASARAVTGLVLGLIGIVVLLWPELRHTSGLGGRHLIGSLSLLGASLSWAVGSVLSKRSKMQLDAFAITGWQMVFAGVVNALIGIAAGETQRGVWSLHSLGALLYLVVFGSLVGFTAYIWLLGNVATAKVATYAYVNPVIAVFLGWLILHEQITAYILAGTVIIVAAVSLVTGAKLQTRETAEPELPAVESTG